jgi:hypothetical protein
MTAAELRAALSKLKLSQQAAARLLGRHPPELAAWARGIAPVPMMIAALVNLLVAARSPGPTSRRPRPSTHARAPPPATRNVLIAA